jgi:ribosomal protein S18 acetylase RimI-like enzyme
MIWPDCSSLPPNGFMRRSGHGKEVVRRRCAGRGIAVRIPAWLQVESANIAAVSLYKGSVFAEVYRYAYRQKPGS